MVFCAICHLNITQYDYQNRDVVTTSTGKPCHKHCQTDLKQTRQATLGDFTKQNAGKTSKFGGK